MRIFLILIIIVLVYLLIHREKCRKVDIAKVLVRQSSRWAIAAHQDKSPLIQLLHANYAAGYLWAAKDLVPSKEIERVAGVSIAEFEKRIVNIQDRATSLTTTTCPQFVGDNDKILLTISGQTYSN